MALDAGRDASVSPRSKGFPVSSARWSTTSRSNPASRAVSALLGVGAPGRRSSRAGVQPRQALDPARGGRRPRARGGGRGAPADRAVTPPSGTRLLVDSVSSPRTGLAAAVGRMLLDGALLTDAASGRPRWTSSSPIPRAPSSPRVATGSAGNGSWRLGGDALAASPAALEEAQQRAIGAAEARVTAPPPRSRAAATELETRRKRKRPRPRPNGARSARSTTSSAPSPASRPSDASARSRSRPYVPRRSRSTSSAPPTSKVSPCWRSTYPARSRSRGGAVAVRVAALVELELDERAATVGAERRDVDLRAAQVTERRQVLEHRLGEVDERLARDPERRAEAERHQRALEGRGSGYAAIDTPA